MSKRNHFEQYDSRKKQKLEVSRSDHNFPLSQNIGADNENWGDENDDEILLLASQACEQAYSNDVSQLPDYSMFMQPGTTSTQFEPIPGSSRGSFSFKKPTTTMADAISTNLKDKCNRINSPLPGMAKVANGCLADNVFNDKIYKNQDSDYVYRQLLQLQEENAKLKSENGKLQEKCVTKEGEASILRTQLKSCQVVVDNVRMEKIKAQEKVQMEWTDKLTAANNQMRDLRTQLDFKNLEIISIKERCRMLESSKVKLTQVTLGPNDLNSSRINNSIHGANDSMSARRVKTVKTTTSGVQTENKTHFVKLNKTCRTSESKLKAILPYIHQATDEQTPLRGPHEVHNQFGRRCRIFSSVHRVANKTERKTKLSIGCLWEDVTCIATSDVDSKERCLNIERNVKRALNDVVSELQNISSRISAAFQREMDERCIEAAGQTTSLLRDKLIGGRCLFKDEQAILPRRMAAILGYILECTDCDYSKTLLNCDNTNVNLIETITLICALLDSTSCAIMYSGLLQSLVIILDLATKSTTTLNSKILDIAKTIITSRPIPTVSAYLVRVLRNIAHTERIMNKICVQNTTGNLKVDYDQGVLLYKKETCLLQILLKQIESYLKCVERELLTENAVCISEDLISFYNHISVEYTESEKIRCDCQLVTSQVLVYAIQICAVMLKESSETAHRSRLDAVCRNGVAILYQWSLAPSMGAGCGRRLIMLAALRGVWTEDDSHGGMLTELLAPLAVEASSPATTTRGLWIDSFARFAIAD